MKDRKELSQHHMAELGNSLRATLLHTFLAATFAMIPLLANAITNADNDQNNRLSNSTVRIEGGGYSCSGTLIAPDIVLTAGHCGFHDDHRGSCPNRWVDINAVSYNPVTVYFGNDTTSPVFSVKATHWNISGSEDIIMLGLEKPVPPEVAVPRRPLTESFYYTNWNAERFWEEQEFILSGYGGKHKFRQIATFKNGRMRCDTLFNQICATGINDAKTEDGDSGGPYYWRDSATGEDYVVGAIKGRGAIVTFGGFLRTGTWFGSTPLGLRLGNWMDEATSASLQDQIKKQETTQQPINDFYDTRLAYQLWSNKYADHFITSDPNVTINVAGPRDLKWEDQEIVNGPKSNGGSYDIKRIEGAVFAYDIYQPPGTVPLISWWSSERKDSFSTTKPSWSIPIWSTRISPTGYILDQRFYKSGYRAYRVEGFIYDPKKPQPPGTVPLFNWWSSELADNYATTNTTWGMNPLAVEWEAGKGEELSFNPPRRQIDIASDGQYRLFRLEGYLPTMDCSEFF